MAKKRRSGQQVPSQHEASGFDSYAVAVNRLRGQKNQIIQDVIPRIIEDYAKDSSLSYESRLSGLTDLLAATADCISALPRQRKVLAHNAPAYKRRDKREYPTPIMFFRAFYSDIPSPTLAEIRHADFELYRALQNWRTRYGWPSDLALRTKPEKTNSLLIEHAGSEPDADSTAKLALKLKPVVQIYEAARYRLRKSKLDR